MGTVYRFPSVTIKSTQINSDMYVFVNAVFVVYTPRKLLSLKEKGEMLDSNPNKDCF